MGSSRLYVVRKLRPAAKAAGYGNEASLRRLLRFYHPSIPQAARVGGLCKSSPQIYLPGGVCRCCPAPRDRNSILLAYHMRRILADPQFLVQLLVHLRDAFPTEVALQFTRPR